MPRRVNLMEHLYREPLFDASSYYWEPREAFSRYLDQSVNAALLDRIHAPFANNQVPDAYRDRDARMARMSRQGVEQAWLFPTVANAVEEELRADPDATMLVFKAFNRWLDDEWGFSYQDRIFAAPYLALADPQTAISQLHWCLEHDARVVMIHPAAARTHQGQASPTHSIYNDLWAAAEDAGVTVAVHAAQVGYPHHGFVAVDPATESVPTRQMIWTTLHQERPIFDFLASVLVDRLLERFPRLRLASIGNGAQFLPTLTAKIAAVRDAHPTWFGEDPIELLRSHLWVAPNWDIDVHDAVENLGAERVLFGSGWPMTQHDQSPADYVGEVAHLGKAPQSAILHGNANFLNQRLPHWADPSTTGQGLPHRA